MQTSTNQPAPYGDSICAYANGQVLETAERQGFTFYDVLEGLAVMGYM